MPRGTFRLDLSPLSLPSGGTVSAIVGRDPGDGCRVFVVSDSRRPTVVLDMAWNDLQAVTGAINRALRAEGVAL